MLSTIPLCIKGWLDICDTKIDYVQFEESKLTGIVPVVIWQSKFCLLLENDSKLYIFNDEPSAEEWLITRQVAHFPLESELSMSHTGDSFIDVSITNPQHNIYESNPSISHSSKPSSKGGLFRNGSRLFRRGKNNTKLGVFEPSHKAVSLDNNQTTTSVSNLKRSLSLSRINRKKSEGSKSPQNKQKNSLMSQSTGDLTIIDGSSSIICYDLNKETNLSEIHASLVGEKLHCFSVTIFAEEIHIGLFAASSNLEKQSWMKRLQLTLKPNMENENRINNSLKVTIFESKCLPAQKRRYYCTVSFDKSLYAKTTSKLSNNDGTVFWAEDFVFNNLPSFKALTISLFKESEQSKDPKRKKKKHSPQYIGQIVFSCTNLHSKLELQSWYLLRLIDRFSDLSLTNGIQLRIRLRFESLKVLKNSAYNSLYNCATIDYLELIQTLEKNLPIKAKEELSICLVNIHEKKGSIIPMLIDLISGEIDDLDNSSMTLRANTIVTKIIESHMKLVGFHYLHDILHSIICDIMLENVAIEVDQSRFNLSEDRKEKLLLTNQHELTKYLMLIWRRIYDSKDRDFPKQLKSVYIGWRNKLTSQTSLDGADQEKIALHCDVIVSGCIFLRLICPAILSPYLFGLVNHFSENNAVQRTLTLIAKSLQSLANFSKFGEKERFMTFLNSCFEDEIPRMHDFLRYISSTRSQFEDVEDNIAVKKEIHLYGSVVDLPVEMARLYNCLVTDEARECIKCSSTLKNIAQLPEIIDHITEQLSTFKVPQRNIYVSSNRKTSVPNAIAKDRRRTLSSQLPNNNVIELSNVERNLNPPILSQTVCQTSLVDSKLDYEDVNNFTADISNTSIRRNKPAVSSSKCYYNISHSSVSQLLMPTTIRGHSTLKNMDLPQVEHVRTKLSEPRPIISSSNVTDNRPKSSTSKVVKSDNMTHSQVTERRSTCNTDSHIHYDKVHDNEALIPAATILKNYKLIDMSDASFYRENPLYDYVAISNDVESTSDSANAINTYFILRTKISLLEEIMKENNGELLREQKEELKNLCKQLDEIRINIHKEQLNDLAQLKSMLEFIKLDQNVEKYSNFNTPKTQGNRSPKSVQSALLTTDVFDYVIKSIAVDGAGLDEAQETLRKHIKKAKNIVKEPSSLDCIRNSNNSGHSIPRVSGDISDYLSDVIDSSTNILNSSPCSNRSSSLTASLI